MNVQETTDSDAKERVVLHKCDLAIVTDAVDLSNVKKTFLFRSQYCVIINKDNPLSKKDILKFEDYESQRIIGKSSELKYYWQDVNKKMNNKQNYNFIVELNNARLREELVQKNYGIALAWDYTIVNKRQIDNCVIRPLYYEGWGADIYMLEYEAPYKKDNLKIVKDAIKSWITSHAIP